MGRKRVLTPFSYALPVEFRLGAGAVDLERAVLADRVRPVEDPVLPGGEAAEDARQHGLGAGEAQARLHAGERIGRQAGALLDRQADLFLPVELVGRRGGEAGLAGLLGIEELAAREGGGFAPERGSEGGV